MHRPASLAAALLSALLVIGVAGCSDGSPAEPDATPTPTGATPSAEPGTSLPTLECRGESGLVVVLETGLGTPIDTLDVLDDALPTDVRVCRSERAGNGMTPALAADAPDPSPGRAADALHEALEAEGVAGPYVMVGWSYGGLVTQAFANRYRDDLAGVVLLDSSVAEQFTEQFWLDFNESIDFEWAEGGRPIDQDAAVADVAGLELEGVPYAVITQGEPRGEFRRVWTREQGELASASPDALHVVADDAGHALHEDALPLVVEVVTEVLAGTPAACDERFAGLAGTCA